MSIASSTYYYKPKLKKDDSFFLDMIHDVLDDLPETGYLSMTKILNRKTKINKKKVYRIMTENGLLCRKKRAFKSSTTDSRHSLKKFPNLVKGKNLENMEILFGDVTAFDIKGKDAFLACLMRHKNREIVGFSVSYKNNTELVLAALLSAKVKLRSMTNFVHHTDTDVRYCSKIYIHKAIAMGLKISMCKGNAYENPFAESLNKTIKYKEINLNEYENIEEAYNCIEKYIYKYNTIKPHTSLGNLTPMEYKEKIGLKNLNKK